MGKLRGAVAHDVTKSERTADVVLPEGISFADMLLNEKTLAGLQRAGFRRPSPIQRSAIPVGRCGTDLIVEAKSGTGKTLVFGIIALEMIDVAISQLQVLIVAPTREIAIQIKQVLKSIGCEYEGLKIHAFIGGTDLKANVAAAASCHIAVGTPGRIKQLVKEGHLNCRATRLFVLDEADCLVTQSFKKDINFIFTKLPEHKQTLVVSATFPGPLEELLAKYLLHPRRISTTPSSAPLLLGLRQFITVTTPHMHALVRVRNKTDKLLAILSSFSFRQCLIFFNLQSRMEGICQDLAGKGWPALHLAGSMPQTERLAVVAALQAQRCRVLLTTDLAARGIDAEQVDLVVNMDLPYDTETYLHRIGRAGRFGAPGVAVSIVEDGQELKKLQHIFYDVGGPSFKVALLPAGKLSESVWKTGADLEFIGCLEREVVIGQVSEESSDRESKKKKLMNGKAGPFMEPASNGANSQAETLEKDECLQKKQMSREKAIDEVRSWMGKDPPLVQLYSYNELEEMCRTNKTDFGPAVEEKLEEDTLLREALEVLAIEDAKSQNNYVTEAIQNFEDLQICSEFDNDSESGSEVTETADTENEEYSDDSEEYNEEESSSELDSDSEDCDSSFDGDAEDESFGLERPDGSFYQSYSQLPKCEANQWQHASNSKPCDYSNNCYSSLCQNGSDCQVCSSWFLEWSRQLACQRQALQYQIYMKEILEN